MDNLSTYPVIPILAAVQGESVSCSASEYVTGEEARILNEMWTIRDEMRRNQWLADHLNGLLSAAPLREKFLGRLASLREKYGFWKQQWRDANQAKWVSLGYEG